MTRTSDGMGMWGCMHGVYDHTCIRGILFFFLFYFISGVGYKMRTIADVMPREAERKRERSPKVEARGFAENPSFHFFFAFSLVSLLEPAPFHVLRRKPIAFGLPRFSP